MERLEGLFKIVETRGSICDKGMRVLAQARKDRFEEIETDRRDEERKERLRLDAAAEEERGRKKTTSKNKKNVERPLTHGAHVLAPQDGSNQGLSWSLHTNNITRKKR